MNIPNMPSQKEPIGTITLSGKDYPIYISEVWYNMLNQLMLELQKNTSNEGLIAPPQPTSTRTQLNISKLAGAILYDSTLNKGFLNENGTFKQIVTA